MIEDNPTIIVDKPERYMTRKERETVIFTGGVLRFGGLWRSDSQVYILVLVIVRVVTSPPLLQTSAIRPIRARSVFTLPPVWQRR